MGSDKAVDAAARFGQVMDGVWLASAMACVLDRRVAGPFASDDPAARLLAAWGFLEHTESGLIAAPGFAAAVGGRESAYAAAIRSTLGQAATVAFAGENAQPWSAFSDDILAAQATASAMFGPLLASLVVPSLDGLAERFAAGGRFLDVGVGAAGLACAFCQALPTARVVGIDVLPRALELAAKAVADRDLPERIELRLQGVEALEDSEAFDLAWIPLPFIPPSVVSEGLVRLHRALEPGGWLLLPGSVRDSGRTGAMAEWQTHVAGGTLLSDQERCRLLAEAGFESLRPLPVPPGAPPLLAARRSS